MKTKTMIISLTIVLLSIISLNFIQPKNIEEKSTKSSIIENVMADEGTYVYCFKHVSDTQGEFSGWSCTTWWFAWWCEVVSNKTLEDNAQASCKNHAIPS